MTFSVCYPDANSFDDIIKVKSLEDWHVKYVRLTEQTGYWLADSPFYDEGFVKYRELVKQFPIQKNNNDSYCKDPNPFSTIHLPPWAFEKVCELIKFYYYRNITTHTPNEMINEWGNVYQNNAKPLRAFRIPHVDYENGIVGNLWFTDHSNGTSGTNIYEYTGQRHGLFYDFQVDTSHKLYKEYSEISLTDRLTSWANFTDDEADHWGFRKVGMAPAIEGKMTMYKASVSHCPYIDNTVKFRWSHAYAYYHEDFKFDNIRKFL